MFNPTGNAAIIFHSKTEQFGIILFDNADT
jgi:hypothetical protein